VPDGPVTLQLSVHKPVTLVVGLGCGHLAVKELMTGADTVGCGLGVKTVMQTVFWSLPHWLLTERVQQPVWGGFIAIVPVIPTERFSPPHVRKALPAPVIDQLSITCSPAEICMSVERK